MAGRVIARGPTRHGARPRAAGLFPSAPSPGRNPCNPSRGGAVPYPVTFEADYVEKRSRLSTFFRWILVIPHAIVLYLWTLAAYIVVLIAWFAIVITGRWPKGLQDMIVLGVSYQQRANTYIYLLTEDWPPFTDEGAARVEPAPAFGALPSTPPAAGPEAPPRIEPTMPAGEPEAPIAPPAPAPEAPSEAPPEAPAGTPAGPPTPGAPETPPTQPHGDPLGDEATPEPPASDDDEPPPGPFGPSSSNP